MSCAVHPQVPVAAYCRICGTALCEACKRSIKGLVYCENCVAERLGSPDLPPSAVVPGVLPGTAGSVHSSPSPGLAAVLAILFPFGVGQVYAGLYAKGLAHLLVLTTLIWGASHGFGGLEVFFGLGIAFFYFYQIIDAYKSAQAVQMGLPAPDPFDLGNLFSAGSGSQRGYAPRANSTSSDMPAGALVLIGLGVLFLLGNLGVLRFYWLGRFWSALLIGLGVWLLLRRRPEAEAPARDFPREENPDG